MFWGELELSEPKDKPTRFSKHFIIIWHKLRVHNNFKYFKVSHKTSLLSGNHSRNTSLVRSAQSKNTLSVPTARLHHPKKLPLLYILLIHPFMQSQFWETNRRAWGFIMPLPLNEQSKRSTPLPPKPACSSVYFNVKRTTYYYTLLNIAYYIYRCMYLCISQLRNQTRALHVFPQTVIPQLHSNPYQHFQGHNF